jgi:uncharacterized integral membrane protein
MKTFLKWAALAPVLAIVLVFSVVNRQPVRVIFDPFGGANSGLSATVPLFLALFAAAILGVFLGGAAAWIGQARHRRGERAAQAELARLRVERDRLAAQASASTPSIGRTAA